MKKLIKSLKWILSNRDSGIMKILLLGIGMAMTFVIITKIYFDNTYDNFIPEADRTYRLKYSLKRESEDLKFYSNTPGAYAPALLKHSPRVEAATRFTWINYDALCSIVSNQKSAPVISTGAIIADTMFFKTLPRPTIGESPAKILSQKRGTLISRTLAQSLSPDGIAESMIGEIIEFENTEDSKLNILGIFEDFPTNSTFNEIDIVISLNSIGIFTWDGSTQWLGNDRYSTYLRLTEGAKTEEVLKDIDQMLVAENVNLDEYPFDLKLVLEKATDHYSQSDDVKKMTSILSILAISVLLVALLNYVLIEIAGIVRRSKNIATHKCYGAPKSAIYRMMFADALAAFLLSLGLAVILILVFQTKIETLIFYQLNAMLSLDALALLIATAAFILAICGLIPAFLYAQIPSSAAYRGYQETRKKWKQGLLFLQISGTMFFITLLSIIIFQYHHLTHSDIGYDYENVLCIDVWGQDDQEISLLKNRIAELSETQAVSISSILPIASSSGNNVMTLDEPDYELFNVIDNYFIDENYIDLLNIKIVNGTNFSPENADEHSILVSKAFVEKMKVLKGWSDNAIGKEVLISEHSGWENTPYTIIGVYEDYLYGNATWDQDRPSVYFYYKSHQGSSSYIRYLSIKVNETNPKIIKNINDICTELFPDRNLSVESYKTNYEALYEDSKKFRDTVLYAAIVVLLITIIGLIGYVKDEISRRRSEVAIRKINGATVSEIIHLFLNKFIALSLFAIVVGGAAAYFAGENWLSQFARRTSLHWWIFALCTISLCIIIAIAIIISIQKTARANPVNNLQK